MVKRFRTVDPHGNPDYGATSHLKLTEPQRQLVVDRAGLVEGYPRALQQFTGLERGQFRLEPAQPNPIGLASRADLRLEYQRWPSRLSILNCKLDLMRLALRHYLAHPIYCLPSTA